MKLDGVVAVGGTAAAVQTRRRQSWMPAAFVAALALVCRLGYWLCLTPSRVLTSDAAQYNGLAANLARGRGYVDTFPQLALHPTAFRPPLYPALLALFYWPLGVHPGLGRAINVVIGTLVVAVAYLVVRRHAGRTAALGTGIALAIAPNLIANDTYVLNEPWRYSCCCS